MSKAQQLKDFSKFLKKVTLFIVVSFPLLYLADIFYSSRVVNKLDEKPMWILSKKNQKYDYAILGSSRAFNNFSVDDADSLMHTKGINLGVSASAFPQNLLCLDQFYRNGNSIKTLIVQVDAKGFQPPSIAYTYPFYDFCYFHLLGKSEFTDSIFKANTPPTLKYYFRRTMPFFKYAEFNNKYPAFHVATRFNYMFEKKNGFDYGSGSKLLTGNQDTEEQYLKSSKEHLALNTQKDTLAVEPEMKNTLIKIVSLARGHNTKVIFFTSPMLSPFNDNAEELYKHVDKIAEANNVTYFKMMKDSVSEFRTLFYDGGHLNKEGAKAFTLRFCRKIISNK
ncbi:MAG: hypothetical protein IAF38_14315 [Bacteroidia bacterium]|nr:hypothetical protein [Bacteroidia bacterium]